MPDDAHLKPVCFMVMPFRRKKVDDPKGQGAPAELNCDALWDKAFRPAIEELGYLAIRADYDPGTVIVKDMLERLALANLVLADVSLPNGNVYYEVGLRHVAQETSCVLLAATWSRQLFDIDQFTSIRYVLTDGDVTDAEALAIRKLLVEKVPLLKDSRTPYHEFIRGGGEELMRRGVFHDFAERLSAFQARVGEVRLHREPAARRAKVEQLRIDFAGTALEIPDVAIELVNLIRDELDWAATTKFIETLPPATRELPFMKEQYLLAVANMGRPEEAIALLEELVARHGDTPERQGLIGGRCKRLWRDARAERVQSGETRPSIHERRWLDRAIDHYQRGMDLDLNQYYCSSNLPALLRARGRTADADRAFILDHFVVAACERALKRGEADEWARPTLLGAAFRGGDSAKARELADRIEIEGVASWKLDSTLDDLEGIVEQTTDVDTQAELKDIYERLRELQALDAN